MADTNFEASELILEETGEDLQATPVTLIAKWGKERIRLENMCPSTTLSEVKATICERTNILPKRQKLIGFSFKTKGQAEDTCVVSDLLTKKKGKKIGNEVCYEFILMGTPEESIFVDPLDKDDLPDVIDDFDFDFTAESEEWIKHVANGDNLRKFTESTQIHIIHQPRLGKPLAVLDLDHTLLDFSSKQLMRGTVGDNSASVLKRPYMDEFLTSAYRRYDLVVWSQTSWRWLETKLTELGMLTNPGYRFCFVLDKTSMFHVRSIKRDGTEYRHQVKPLQIIWNHFPQWGEHNTVHVDDLSRNFALNLGSGLKVTPYYRKKRSSGRRDCELLGLSRYFEMLATDVDNFSDVDFRYWIDVINGKRPLTNQEREKK